MQMENAEMQQWWESMITGRLRWWGGEKLVITDTVKKHKFWSNIFIMKIVKSDSSQKMLYFLGQCTPLSSEHEVLWVAFISKDLMETKWFVGM